MLFRPDLIGEECEGIHEVLMFSIQKSDLDLRKVLLQNIVLSGGSTLFRVCTNYSVYVEINGNTHTRVCVCMLIITYCIFCLGFW